MQRKAIGLLAIAGATMIMATTAAACPNCKKNYSFGKPTPIGNGMAFTWVRFNKETKAIESFGVTLTETALQGLPTVEQMKDPKMPTMEYILDVPAEIKGFPFDHVGIDWNPVGHEPAKMYDVPHFDIHFYTISQSTRAQITGQGDNLKIATKKPEAKFLPAGYILPPIPPIPNMGMHWIDPTSPEFNGKPFSSTFIFGSYDGKPAFWEPMVTKAFLESKPDFSQKIGVPQAYQASGLYPTGYSITYNGDRKEISIALDGLIEAKGLAHPTAAVKRSPAKAVRVAGKSRRS